MNYKQFKTLVLSGAGGTCENPHCDADATQVHHFLKRSLYPEYVLDVDNGMAVCGPCHAEIERRLRQGEDARELMPVSRLDNMIIKAGG